MVFIGARSEWFGFACCCANDEVSARAHECMSDDECGERMCWCRVELYMYGLMTVDVRIALVGVCAAGSSHIH